MFRIFNIDKSCIYFRYYIFYYFEIDIIDLMVIFSNNKFLYLVFRKYGGNFVLFSYNYLFWYLIFFCVDLVIKFFFINR